MKGWKTLTFAFLLGGFGALEATVTDVVSAESAPYVLIVVGAVVAILRTVTNTDAGKSA